MELNPFTALVHQGEQDLDLIARRLTKARSELTWVSAYDASAEDADASALQEKLDKLETRRDGKLAKLRPLQAQSAHLKAAASKEWFNPGHWFADRSKEQRQLSDHRDRVRGLEREVEDLDQKIDQTASDLRRVDRRRQRFALADASALEAEIRGIEQQLPVRQLEIENLRSQEAYIERLLEPRRDELTQHRTNVRQAEERLELARDLEARMSAAANSYERRLLHDECASRFGKSSPRAVVRDLERSRDSAARGLSNAEWQIRRDVKIAAAIGKGKVSGRSDHQRKVRSWIALAQLEAWLYENAHLDPSRLIAVQADASDLRRRLTQPMSPRARAQRKKS